ncbi:unnamed protein product [Acanthoscelides obtectus]|uniref:Sine oculis-binding protein n=1 Tax=Acanthoscelides obtectus TaxID=200917 RepID=A0A9P0KF44_ACAOB|nr:unnamed protein product [Acanthoscelides obtectus]CAK1632369.1 Sine oculis-binding protein homolog [Acanthoscelides obtectus]
MIGILFYLDCCGWCNRPVDENTALTSASATYCSELCFSQSRRATFKKNKTCDWCRHVRHTVSYVDFQDGASQLQFCSDKCLNQYKMHIFCRETRAHLELHPHLHNESSSSTGGNLITPDLWLRNCRSPENNRSPSPVQASADNMEEFVEKPQQTSPLPLIAVTHPSKLMESPEVRKNRFKSQKKTRKRLPSATVTCNNYIKPISNDLPQDLRVRHTPTDFDNKVKDRIPSAKPESAKPGENCKSTNPPEEPKTPSFFKPFGGILPSPTLLVPYPIIIPLPIPIPIPIPIPLKDPNKETAEVSLQTEVLDEDATSQTEIDVVGLDEKEDEEVKRISTRHVRKRKRLYEPKIGIRKKTIA